MKKITTSVVVLSLAMIANAALAALPMPNGVYVEGNVGQSFAHYDTDYMQITPWDTISLDHDGLGGNLNVGYKFNPYFAAEAGYTYYASTKIKLDGFTIGKVNQYAIDVAAKGILPINTTGFELFGKLGVASIQQDGEDSLTGDDVGSQSTISPYIGVGAEYAFTSNVIGNIQFARARGNSDTGSLDLASVGISYLF